jgi:hypothetical protein
MKSLIKAGVLVLLCMGLAVGVCQKVIQIPKRKSVAAAPLSFCDSRPIDRSATQLIPNVSIDIFTSGKPVFVAIVPEVPGPSQNAQPYSISFNGNSRVDPGSRWGITIIRDSNYAVGEWNNGCDLSADNHLGPCNVEVPVSMSALDSPQPGRHIYTVRITGYGKITIQGARLVVYEM